MKKKRRPFALPAPSDSGRLLVSLAPQRVGMFRFLLESYDNLACFTVVDRHEALLTVLFSPHQQAEVRDALQGINETIPLSIRPAVAVEVAEVVDVVDVAEEMPPAGWGG